MSEHPDQNHLNKPQHENVLDWICQQKQQTFYDEKQHQNVNKGDVSNGNISGSDLAFSHLNEFNSLKQTISSPKKSQTYFSFDESNTKVSCEPKRKFDAFNETSVKHSIFSDIPRHLGNENNQKPQLIPSNEDNMFNTNRTYQYFYSPNISNDQPESHYSAEQSQSHNLLQHDEQVGIPNKYCGITFSIDQSMKTLASNPRYTSQTNLMNPNETHNSFSSRPSKISCTTSLYMKQCNINKNENDIHDQRMCTENNQDRSVFRCDNEINVNHATYRSDQTYLMEPIETYSEGIISSTNFSDQGIQSLKEIVSSNHSPKTIFSSDTPTFETNDFKSSLNPNNNVTNRYGNFESILKTTTECAQGCQMYNSSKGTSCKYTALEMNNQDSRVDVNKGEKQLFILPSQEAITKLIPIQRSSEKVKINEYENSWAIHETRHAATEAKKFLSASRESIALLESLDEIWKSKQYIVSTSPISNFPSVAASSSVELSTKPPYEVHTNEITPPFSNELKDFASIFDNIDTNPVPLVSTSSAYDFFFDEEHRKIWNGGNVEYNSAKGEEP